MSSRTMCCNLYIIADRERSKMRFVFTTESVRQKLNDGRSEADQSNMRNDSMSERERVIDKERTERFL